MPLKVSSGFLLLALVFAGGALAQESAKERPKLQTNEDYIRELQRNAALPAGDKKEMLAFVLQSLPERVKIYPTENYYYFGFYAGGVRYSGNIRLDASDRDKGKLHFAYFVESSEWKSESPASYALMGIEDGVKVEKVERFLYRVTLGEKSVLFELNDLSAARPPENTLDPDERYIGPVFDESGVRFFLVYNSKLQIFHYILDETVPLTDQLTRVKTTERIEIATRTGFAFYRDIKRERRILIGVYEGNVLANNYFDGPFDQLPDNFIEGDDLLKAILEIAPDLRGTIDRFGGNLDGSERFLIAPYIMYRREQDLYPVHACAVGPRGKGPRYYECFLGDEAQANGPQGKQKAQPKGKGAPK